MQNRLLLLLTLFVTLVSITEAHAKYPFTVSVEKNGDGHIIVAKNKGYAPVSIWLTLDSPENVTSIQGWPVSAVVRPLQESIILTVRAALPGAGYRFSTRYNHRPGNYFAIHDKNALYRLPFPEGQSYIVSQAAGGKISTHDTPESAYAVDFTMPENTPILAARDGVVIDTEDSNVGGGRDRSYLNKANYVRILHADDTIATYSHLAHQGVKVHEGSRVHAGELIGFSGSTGYSSGPHLHFAVLETSRSDTNLSTVSVPVRFYVGEPPFVFTPQQQHHLTADYKTPGKAPGFAQTKRAP